MKTDQAKPTSVTMGQLLALVNLMSELNKSFGHVIDFSGEAVEINEIEITNITPDLLKVICDFLVEIPSTGGTRRTDKEVHAMPVHECVTALDESLTWLLDDASVMGYIAREVNPRITEFSGSWAKTMTTLLATARDTIKKNKMGQHIKNALEQ